MLETLFNIKTEAKNGDTAKFIIEPLEQGYGQTLGNSLRRVLLTSLPGAAITQVKINGVKHKFSTLDGMSEDIIELVLNLKEVRIKYEGSKPVKLELDKNGSGVVKASDIKTPAGVEVINKDHVLANLASKKSRLKIELVVEKGYGYVPATDKKGEKIGVIPVDAVFSPIKRVNYQVASTRVGQRTDFDKLVMEVTTDGSIDAKEALKLSTQTLIDFFNQIVHPKKMAVKAIPEIEANHEVNSLTLEELDLPTRIVNALRKTGYGTVSDLLGSQPEALAKVKNLGEKSIKIIKAALAKKDVVWETKKK